MVERSIGRTLEQNDKGELDAMMVLSLRMSLPRKSRIDHQRSRENTMDLLVSSTLWQDLPAE